jgi:hypothetical protein
VTTGPLVHTDDHPPQRRTVNADGQFWRQGENRIRVCASSDFRTTLDLARFSADLVSTAATRSVDYCTRPWMRRASRRERERGTGRSCPRLVTAPS